MVIGTLERGGAEHQMVGLAEQLNLRGEDVEVITLHGRGPLQSRLEAAGIPVLCLAPSERAWRIRKVHAALELGPLAVRLRAHWRRWPPDVVQAWLPEAQAVALPIARLAGVPSRLMSLRSLRSGARPGALLDRLLAVAAAASTAITANSQAVASDPGWPTHARERVVIPNGLSVPTQLAEAGRTPARGVVVANLLRYKGHRDLLKALAISTTRPRIVLVGDGPERAALEHEATTLGIRDLVTFEGSVADPMPVLLQNQFAVLPSHTEGLPNAVLEAMGAGLPVIGTDVGGIPELVQHGVSGLITAPRDPAQLAKAIDMVAGNSSERRRMGMAARERALEFAWPVITEKYLALYERTACR